MEDNFSFLICTLVHRTGVAEAGIECPHGTVTTLQQGSQMDMSHYSCHNSWDNNSQMYGRVFHQSTYLKYFFASKPL